MASSITVRAVPTWARRIVWLVMVVWIVGLGISTVYRAGPYSFGDRTWGSRVHRTDFTIYTAVGQAILDGKDIYEAENPRGWHYNNAPVFGLLFVPFAMLPVFWAALIWYLLSVVVVVFAVYFSVQMVRQSAKTERDVMWLYILPPLLLMWPLMSALARGQMTPLLFGLVMAGVFCQSRGKEWLGGGFLAGAILMKIFPVFLLPYYVWKKRWRFIAATMLFVALGIFVVPTPFLGWDRNMTFHKEWASILHRPAFEQGKSQDPRFGELISPDLVRNQSLQAVLKRVTHLAYSEKIAAGIGVVMAILMILVALQAGKDDRWLLLSTAIAWALLMSPVSWSHYFMLLLLPVAALVIEGVAVENTKKRRVARGVLIGFALLAVPFAGSRVAQIYGPLCGATLVVWGGLLFCARGERVSSM
jgi:alpha-1,2-mannosyltransferase